MKLYNDRNKIRGEGGVLKIIFFNTQVCPVFFYIIFLSSVEWGKLYLWTDNPAGHGAQAQRQGGRQQQAGDPQVRHGTSDEGDPKFQNTELKGFIIFCQDILNIFL